MCYSTKIIYRRRPYFEFWIEWWRMFLIGLLEQIKNEEIVLPDIQRDFVWDKKSIEKLFDSIMRGYPIGIVLLWETYNNIQYRHFIRDYRSDMRYTFYENRKRQRLKLVLDDQQRLQSLYVSLYGSNMFRYMAPTMVDSYTLTF